VTIDVASLQTFSDSELLTIYRNALATGAFRQEMHMQDGRMIRVPAQDQVLKTIAWLEKRIADDASAADGTGGNVAFAKFADPT
jgi:hypothetical protein